MELKVFLSLEVLVNFFAKFLGISVPKSCLMSDPNENLFFFFFIVDTYHSNDELVDFFV